MHVRKQGKVVLSSSWALPPPMYCSLRNSSPQPSKLGLSSFGSQTALRLCCNTLSAGSGDAEASVRKRGGVTYFDSHLPRAGCYAWAPNASLLCSAVVSSKVVEYGGRIAYASSIKSSQVSALCLQYALRDNTEQHSLAKAPIRFTIESCYGHWHDQPQNLT